MFSSALASRYGVRVDMQAIIRTWLIMSLGVATYVIVTEDLASVG